MASIHSTLMIERLRTLYRHPATWSGFGIALLIAFTTTSKITLLLSVLGGLVATAATMVWIGTVVVFDKPIAFQPPPWMAQYVSMPEVAEFWFGASLGLTLQGLLMLDGPDYIIGNVLLGLGATLFLLSGYAIARKTERRRSPTSADRSS